MLEFLSLALFQFFTVGGELVEQVVNDVRRKYLYAEIVRHFLCVTFDLDNKC